EFADCCGFADAVHPNNHHHVRSNVVRNTCFGSDTLRLRGLQDREQFRLDCLLQLFNVVDLFATDAATHSFEQVHCRRYADGGRGVSIGRVGSAAIAGSAPGSGAGAVLGWFSPSETNSSFFLLQKAITTPDYEGRMIKVDYKQKRRVATKATAASETITSILFLTDRDYRICCGRKRD